MKTLNEVTTVLEECFLKNRKEWCIENCPYLQNNEQTCRRDVLVDALDYLKEYQRANPTSTWQKFWMEEKPMMVESTALVLNRNMEQEDIPIEYFENGGI